MTQKNIGKNIALGALGAAAAAGAAAGYYYFYASEDAKEHRRKAAKWAGELKRDVVRQAKKIHNIDRATLASIVDKAAATYGSVRGIDTAELARAARELKDNWRLVAQETMSGAKKKSASAKKTAKKRAPRGKSR